MMRLVLYLLLSATSTAQSADFIPGRFTSENPYRAQPVWISAEAALTADGKLPSGVLAPHEERQIARTAENAARALAASDTVQPPQGRDQCGVTFGALFDDAPYDGGPSATWADVLAKARQRGFISGTVSAAAVGFYAGMPFTVLRVNTSLIDHSADGAVYVLYPRGEIVVNGVRYCTSDGRYGELPATGDAIAFIAVPPIDDTGILYRPRSEDIILGHAGRVVVGGHLQTDSEARSLSSFTAVTESLARAASKRRPSS